MKSRRTPSPSRPFGRGTGRHPERHPVRALPSPSVNNPEIAVGPYNHGPKCLNALIYMALGVGRTG